MEVLAGHTTGSAGRRARGSRRRIHVAVTAMPLLALSVVAIGFAAFFGALWWRLMHQDRLRSAARVAALSNEIDDVTPAAVPAGTVSVQPEFLAHEAPQ